MPHGEDGGLGVTCSEMFAILVLVFLVGLAIMASGAGFGSVASVLGLFVAYFLPTIIAASRGHLSTGAIFVVNLLAGWTIVCWLWALIWSLTGNTEANRDARLNQL
jgi:Superinfection immunity protein